MSSAYLVGLVLKNGSGKYGMNRINMIERGREGKRTGKDYEWGVPRSLYMCLSCE